MAGSVEPASAAEVEADDVIAAVSSRPRIWRAAWRQHRWWTLGAVALAALGALTLVLAVVLIPPCAGTAWWETPGATCNMQPSSILWKLYRIGMLLLPVLVGAVLGAVTFGPDVEHRTQVFALSQRVSRRHWWLTKVVVTAAPVFLASVLLGMANLVAIHALNDAAANHSTFCARF